MRIQQPSLCAVHHLGKRTRSAYKDYRALWHMLGVVPVVECAARLAVPDLSGWPRAIATPESLAHTTARPRHRRRRHCHRMVRYFAAELAAHTALQQHTSEKPSLWKWNGTPLPSGATPNDSAGGGGGVYRPASRAARKPRSGATVPDGAAAWSQSFDS